MIEISHSDWLKAAEERSPDGDIRNVRFKCPVCGHVATPTDWKRAGATDGQIAFSCIGRNLERRRRAFGERVKDDPDHPCDYAGGGLFGQNPIRVLYDDGGTIDCFDFADDPLGG